MPASLGRPRSAPVAERDEDGAAANAEPARSTLPVSPRPALNQTGQRQPPRLPLRCGDRRHPATRSPHRWLPGGAHTQGLPDPGRVSGSKYPRRSRRSPAGGKPCRLRRRRVSVKEPACGVRLVGEHLQPPAQLGDRRELGASVHHAAGDHASPSPARSPSRRQGLTPRPPASVNTLKPTERRPPQQRLSTRQRTCRSAASLRASPTSPSCVPQSPPVAATGITCGPFRDTAPVCDPRSPHLAPPHSATGQWALDAAPSVTRLFRVTGAPQRGGLKPTPPLPESHFP